MRSLEELLKPVALPPEHRDLVCQFLLIFSRFEFALKVSGYSRQQGEQLIVDWRRFARETEPNTAGQALVVPFDAFRALIERPPAKQKAVDGRLTWEDEISTTMVTLTLEWLLEMVYRVRNNLFHGGKWPAQPERDAELLGTSLMLLSYCFDLREDISEAYFGAQ